MAIRIRRAAPRSLEIDLAPDVDASDPRVGQAATYRVSERAGAAGPRVIGVEVRGRLVLVAHDPTRLGESYLLEVGPLSLLSGGDNLPEKVPFFGAGEAWLLRATPEGRGKLRLTYEPSMPEFPGAAGVQVRPASSYPVSPKVLSAAVDPDGSTLLAADWWTDLTYDVAVGPSRERLLWEAEVSGPLTFDGLVGVAGPGSSATLRELLPGAAVLDLAIAGEGSADLRAALSGAGRELAVEVRCGPDGWEVLAGGLRYFLPGVLALRLAILPASGLFAVLAQAGAVWGGPLSELPAATQDGSLVRVKRGTARLLTWLADGVYVGRDGNPVLARTFSRAPDPATASSIRTLKRPLVSRLGPHVPAGPEDVELRVAGAVVKVASVDPYMGIVVPEVPIPRGVADVKVEYETTPHLVFPLLAGEPGLWAGEVTSPVGPESPSGFPFSAVIGYGARPRPPRTAHRYLAARRSTSSLLGDPIGLRVGRDPYASQPEPIVRDRPRVDVELRTSAEAVEPPWELLGDGAVDQAPEGPGFRTVPGSAFFLARNEDLRDVATAYATARLEAGPPSSAEVEVGPGIGFHDESRLYLLAVVDSRGLRHAGVLLNPEAPQDLRSWSIWPRATLTARDQRTLAAPPSDLPRLLAVGDYFRIPEGPQAGTYQVASLRGSWPSGMLEIGVSPELPADAEAYGCREVVAWFDLGPGTVVLRIEADLGTGFATISSTGARALLAQDDSEKPAPSRLLAVSPGSVPGRYLLGHCLRGRATDWGIFAGGAEPVADPLRLRKRVILGPRGLPDPDWAPIGDVSASPAEVVSTSGSSESGILRPERLLGPDALASLDATTRVLFATGTSAVQAEISNGVRRAVLSSLAYDEVEGRLPYRQLVKPSYVRLDLREGWEGGSWQDGQVSVEPKGRARWTASFPWAGGRLLDLDVSIPGAGSLRIELAGGAGSDVSAAIELGRSDVRILSASGAEIGRHVVASGQIRLLAALDPALGISLLVEGAEVPLLAPPAAMGGGSSDGVLEMTLSNPSRSRASFRFSRAAVAPQLASGTRFTFGILRDISAPEDLDSWEIPREDASTAKNSEEAGPRIREMDPRVGCSLRVVVDPQWGAIFLRPDLPPPPYYDPSRARFAGDLSEPSAGWVNVAYENLPTASGPSPYLWLGSGHGARVRFERVRAVAETRGVPGEVGFVPAAETCRDDQADSGDQAQTPHPAVVTCVPEDSRQARFGPSGLWLRTVLQVVDGDRTLAPPDVVLDAGARTVRLRDGVPDFSGGVLEIRGNPALPVNEVYLRQLPVRGSPNEVGERTPPIFPRYFSAPTPEILPDPSSTGRAIEFPTPPPATPLLPREVFQVEQEGQAGLISFPTDSASAEGTRRTAPGGEPLPTPPGPPPDGEGPVIRIEGGLFWDRIPLFNDGTGQNHVQLNGPFRPAGGRHPGTPTMGVPPRKPAAVLLPAGGPHRRGNPRVVLTGPGGAPLPLPPLTLNLVQAGFVVAELDDGMGVKTYRFVG